MSIYLGIVKIVRDDVSESESSRKGDSRKGDIFKIKYFYEAGCYIQGLGREIPNR